jgi:uncharacterized membrane protein YraQ (UPF0718 family)
MLIMNTQNPDKKQKKGDRGMLIATIIMAVIAIILLVIGLMKGEGAHVTGLKTGLNLTIQVVPLMLFAFIIAGMAQTLIPPQVISRWIGEQSGIRGIFIGCIVGGLTPGGPYVSLPIVAGIYKAGAGIGTTVAFLTAWSLWAVARLPMEVSMLGPRFVMIRLISTLIFPPLAGLIAHFLFRK